MLVATDGQSLWLRRHGYFYLEQLTINFCSCSLDVACCSSSCISCCSCCCCSLGVFLFVTRVLLFLFFTCVLVLYVCSCSSGVAVVRGAFTKKIITFNLLSQNSQSSLRSAIQRQRPNAVRKMPIRLLM